MTAITREVASNVTITNNTHDQNEYIKNMSTPNADNTYN